MLQPWLPVSWAALKLTSHSANSFLGSLFWVRVWALHSSNSFFDVYACLKKNELDECTVRFLGALGGTAHACHIIRFEPSKTSFVFGIPDPTLFGNTLGLNTQIESGQKQNILT